MAPRFSRFWPEVNKRTFSLGLKIDLSGWERHLVSSPALPHLAPLGEHRKHAYCVTSDQESRQKIQLTIPIVARYQPDFIRTLDRLGDARNIGRSPILVDLRLAGFVVGKQER